MDSETDTTTATIDTKEKIEEPEENNSFLSFDKFKQIYNDIVDRFKSEENLNYNGEKEFPDLTSYVNQGRCDVYCWLI